MKKEEKGRRRNVQVDKEKEGKEEREKGERIEGKIKEECRI